VRRHAAVTLGKNPRGSDALLTLLDLLQDPEADVRAAAAEAVRRLDPPAAARVGL
jgi:hypothetical protein